MKECLWQLCHDEREQEQQIFELEIVETIGRKNIEDWICVIKTSRFSVAINRKSIHH